MEGVIHERGVQTGSARRREHNEHNEEETTRARVASQMRKTKVCRFGPHCLHGDQCDYAHNTTELRHRPNLSKTSLCPQWLAGTCTLDSQTCAFAHGRRELRITEAFIDTLKRQQGGAHTQLGGAQMEFHDGEWPQVGVMLGPEGPAVPSTCLAPSKLAPATHRPCPDEDVRVQSLPCAGEAASSSSAPVQCQTLLEQQFDVNDLSCLLGLDLEQGTCSNVIVKIRL